MKPPPPASETAAPAKAEPFDAGRAQAGSLHAGDLDAGDLDAGRRDAESRDAGPLDEERREAGQRDAEPFHAEPLDAAAAFDDGPSDPEPPHTRPTHAGPLHAGPLHAAPFHAMPDLRGDGAQTAPRTVGAVVHALRVLRHLAALAWPEGVTAVARATGINTSTCFNILRTLTAEGLVSFDPHAKTYRMGMGVLDLAAGVIGAAHVDLIRPEMERLAHEWRTVIGLWRLTPDGRLILLDRAFAAITVRIEIAPGRRLPAYAGAVGRMIAAAEAPAPEVLRRRFAQVRWQRPVAFDDWAAEVREAARAGHALDRGRTYAGVDAAAAVVVDRAGAPRYGLSGIAIEGQLSEDRLHALGRALDALGRRIGAALFAVSPEAP